MRMHETTSCMHTGHFHREQPSSPVHLEFLDAAVQRAWSAQVRSLIKKEKRQGQNSQFAT